MNMQRADTIESLRRIVAEWKATGLRVGFVPTMGALHAGHISLVAAAKAVCDRVVVSIFVNPTQFAPGEDFERYPRTLDADMSLLEGAQADCLFLPTVSQIYPQGFSTTISVSGVSDGLDGAARPGHFDGVATVVSKLFHQVQPDDAFFGQKDYQQLQVIIHMVADLDMPVRIHGVPTLREADGLAMSSRNRYLSDDERAIAPRLHAVLQETASALRAHVAVSTALAQGVELLKSSGFTSVDYLELRGSGLEPIERYVAGARLLTAVRLGTTRLIDNIEV